MENKDNIYKLIVRTLLIGFVLFSLYSVVFMDDSENVWMVIPFIVGMFTIIGVGITLIFSLVGICVFLITTLISWAFDTDYFI